MLCDKWTELDACYILAGMIPKTMKPDEEGLIRIKDGNRPSSSDIEEYHRIKGCGRTRSMNEEIKNIFYRIRGS